MIDDDYLLIDDDRTNIIFENFIIFFFFYKIYDQLLYGGLGFLVCDDFSMRVVCVLFFVCVVFLYALFFIRGKPSPIY